MALTAFLGASPAQLEYYVSPNGSDFCDGLSPERPFRTIRKAQEVVRGRAKDTAVTVYLRGGEYVLEGTCYFTAEDSGTAESPVLWRNYQDERPIVSGGRHLTGWNVEPDGTWSLVIPDAGHGMEWDINQLFVNGERRLRCRWPKEGFLRGEECLPAEQFLSESPLAPDHCSHKAFRYNPAELPPQEDLSNSTLILFHSWNSSIHRGFSLDAATQTLTLDVPTTWPIGQFDSHPRYYLENLPAAFTSPGDWYFDYHTNTLHYHPFPGESTENTTVIAPRLRYLLVLRGTEDKPVENITFQGISFQYSAFHQPPEETYDSQAGCTQQCAILLEHARHCRLQNLELSHLGETALQFGIGTSENTLFHSELHDMGGGGVAFTKYTYAENPPPAPKGNCVDNCFIHNGGLLIHGSVGVIIYQRSHNQVLHNEICDFYYTAVSVGWSWGYAPSTANHNIIEGNHLHHIGYGLLSDMGAVYTLGISPGTIVRGNLVHDVFAYKNGGWGLYADEGSTDILWEHNLVYNTKSGGFHQHYGRENIVRNNLLAFAQEGQVIRSRVEEHKSFYFYNNVVVFDNGLPYGVNWKDGHYETHDNIYWDVSGKPFLFLDESLETLQARGQEVGTRIVEPGFVNVLAHDFTLLPNAPAEPYLAETLSIIKNAGLYGEKSWTDKPGAIVFKQCLAPHP